MKIVPFSVPVFSRENCSLTPRLVPRESAYSIISRFAAANSLHGKIILPMFRNKCRIMFASRTNNLASLYSVDIGAFERELDLSKPEVYDLFLTPNYLKNHWSICSFLRYCPTCMEQGIHYAIFQFDMLTECPVHKKALQIACHLCGAVTPFSLTMQTFSTPFGCAQCKGSLFCGDYRHSSRALRSLPGLPEAGERVYRALQALAVKKLSVPLLNGSRVRADKVIPAMQLEAKCHHDDELFFSGIVSDLNRAPLMSLHSLVYRSRTTITDLPHPLDVGGTEFNLLLDELTAVLKAVIRRECFELRVTLKSVTWASGSSLLESAVRGLAGKAGGVEVLVQWHRLWCGARTPQDHPRGRAAIGYVVSSWLERFYRENRDMSLSSRERSWLTKHVFVDEVRRALSEFRRERQLSSSEAAGTISDETAFVSPCWGVEIGDNSDEGVRLISYLRQVAA